MWENIYQISFAYGLVNFQGIARPPFGALERARVIEGL